MNIEFNEILHYLGYKGQEVDANTKKMIDTCIYEISGIARRKHLYNFFNMKKLNGDISLQDSTLVFSGKDITNHLKYSLKCVIIAVTLGIEVDKRIAFYSKMDLYKSIVMDACASAAVEALCDEVEDEIRAKASHNGLYITSRYSPGYGDFPLELQLDIINVLDAYKKIGLSVTENSLLIPRKSITAVIGIQKIPPNYNCFNEKCAACHNIDCNYRKGGKLRG
ncbi:MAG: vitamin B12 dependent-methionine synthase activation domain-containing protein [Tepidanaerobacteraceae bacterium]|nr:vitamin B12 dependent-methionine synthase activation domain-containing protein [Tepidanaerobacteraceae bacterium]